MSMVIRYEARLFLMSVGTGAGLMVVYDCIRVFRLLCPHRPWVVNVEDLLYGLYCAVMTFMLLYEQNDGSLRGFCVAGVILGMAAYQYLVSRGVLKYLQKQIKWIKMRVRRHQNRSRQEKR